MIIQQLEIPDIKVIELKAFADSRGYFMETWRREWFADLLTGKNFVQDNQSQSIKGTLRGLHYQIQKPQGKYIHVISGTIFDVVVDMRKSSATFGKWLGIELSSERKTGLWVPEGFAHGFMVLSDVAEVAYKCTEYYAAEHERSLLWNDPALDIKWPVVDTLPVVSDKDKKGLPLSECETFL